MHVLKFTSIICERGNNWFQQFEYKEDSLEQLGTSGMPFQVSGTVIIKLIEWKKYNKDVHERPDKDADGQNRFLDSLAQELKRGIQETKKLWKGGQNPCYPAQSHPPLCRYLDQLV